MHIHQDSSRSSSATSVGFLSFCTHFRKLKATLCPLHSCAKAINTQTSAIKRWQACSVHSHLLSFLFLLDHQSCRNLFKSHWWDLQLYSPLPSTILHISKLEGNYTFSLPCQETKASHWQLCTLISIDNIVDVVQHAMFTAIRFKLEFEHSEIESIIYN